MRRALAVLASIGLAAGTIALATPAQAAPVRVTVTNGGGGSVALAPSGSQQVGLFEPVRITNNYGASISFVTTCSGLGTSSDTIPDTTFWSVAVTVAQTCQFTITGTGGNTGQFTLVIGGGGGSDSGSSGASGSAPAPVMQQFGLPASGNCVDGYSDSMDWSGVGSGGWGISWAQWVNDGAGGAVCSRTLSYNTSTAKWVVS